jgi:hypothetical protein
MYSCDDYYQNQAHAFSLLFYLYRAQMCLQDAYLNVYRDHLKAEGYQPHLAQNKLRDTDNKYLDEGHTFSFNGEILFSYDVCGNCEAHALQLGLQLGLGRSDNITSLPDVAGLDPKYTAGNPFFAKCPKP